MLEGSVRVSRQRNQQALEPRDIILTISRSSIFNAAVVFSSYLVKNFTDRSE
jgi:hypothetical protein